MSKRHFWTAKEVALLGKDTDRAIAKRLGLTPSAVLLQRTRRGISPYSRRWRASNWGVTELSMLGRYPDAELAKLMGRTVNEIASKRKELGIRAAAK